jgi:hypothetical protein
MSVGAGQLIVTRTVRQTVAFWYGDDDDDDDDDDDSCNNFHCDDVRVYILCCNGEKFYLKMITTVCCTCTVSGVKTKTKWIVMQYVESFARIQNFPISKCYSSYVDVGVCSCERER